MPVIAILGVIIVALGAAYVFIEPSAPAVPVVETQEVNRPDSVIVAEETSVSTSTPETTPEAAPEVTTNDEVAIQAAAAMYTAQATYLTPARTSHTIDVTLTLEGGVVSTASVVYDGGKGFSNGHQERFDKAYKSLVIGKSLDEISLSRVGGASVTSQAFNEAVVKIKSQAS